MTDTRNDPQHAACMRAAVLAIESPGKSIPVYRNQDGYNLNAAGELYAYVQLWAIEHDVARVQVRTAGACSEWLNIGVK